MERKAKAIVAPEIGARKQLFKDAALLAHLLEKDRALTLLKKHRHIFADEAHMLGLPGLEECIDQLYDEGHPIETLLFGGIRMHCLKSAQAPG